MMPDRPRRSLLPALLLLILVASALWATSLSLRPRWIQPRCSASAEACPRAGIFAPDAFAVDQDQGLGDELSGMAQYVAGAAGVAGAIVGATPAAPVGHLLLGLLATAVANGAAMETTRLLVQRPRPYVYRDPSRATQPGDYTSFYSGHVSWVAAASTWAASVAIGRSAGANAAGARRRGRAWSAAWIGLALALTALTAWGRVVSGRHFPTDVLVGALVGGAWGLLLARRFAR